MPEKKAGTRGYDWENGRCVCVCVCVCVCNAVRLGEGEVPFPSPFRVPSGLPFRVPFQLALLSSLIAPRKRAKGRRSGREWRKKKQPEREKGVRGGMAGWREEGPACGVLEIRNSRSCRN